MNYDQINGQCIQKRIQKVLEERNLWPSEGLNLECLKPKSFNCQIAAEYKICVKEHKFDICKVLREYIGTATYTKNYRCDTCAHKKENCQCVVKKYCSQKRKIY